MPIYEYQCMNCGHVFDVMQKFSDEPIKTCPECAKDNVKKLVSATAFQLKGTGWYVTDFKDKDKKKPAAQHNKDKNTGADTMSKDVKGNKGEKA